MGGRKADRGMTALICVMEMHCRYVGFVYMMEWHVYVSDYGHERESLAKPESRCDSTIRCCD